MTANVFKEDVQEVLDSGMNGHIGKPVDLQLVLDTILKYTKKINVREEIKATSLGNGVLPSNCA